VAAGTATGNENSQFRQNSCLSYEKCRAIK
jgi:hypothetical protein